MVAWCVTNFSHGAFHPLLSNLQHTNRASFIHGEYFKLLARFGYGCLIEDGCFCGFICSYYLLIMRDDLLLYVDGQ